MKLNEDHMLKEDMCLLVATKQKTQVAASGTVSETERVWCAGSHDYFYSHVSAGEEVSASCRRECVWLCLVFNLNESES